MFCVVVFKNWCKSHKSFVQQMKIDHAFSFVFLLITINLSLPCISSIFSFFLQMTVPSDIERVALSIHVFLFVYFYHFVLLSFSPSHSILISHSCSLGHFESIFFRNSMRISCECDRINDIYISKSSKQKFRSNSISY